MKKNVCEMFAGCGCVAGIVITVGDEARICYYPPYGDSKTGCCAHEKICGTAYPLPYSRRRSSVTNAGQNNVVLVGTLVQQLQRQVKFVK